jgi:hypothetical protein
MPKVQTAQGKNSEFVGLLIENHDEEIFTAAAEAAGIGAEVHCVVVHHFDRGTTHRLWIDVSAEGERDTAMKPTFVDISVDGFVSSKGLRV